MAGSATDGGSVAVEGAELGQAVIVRTIEAGTVASISIIKFLRLLKL